MAIFWMILILSLSASAQGADWDATLDTGAGLDDNVARSSSGNASAFLMLGGEGAVQFQSGSKTPLMTSAYLFGRYQDFLDGQESHYMGIGTDITGTLMEGTLIPGLTMEGSQVRNGERPDENRNAFRLSGTLRWLAGARLSLAVSEDWSRRFYEEALSTNSAPTRNEVSRGKGKNGNSRSQDDDRRDDLMLTELIVTFHLTPRWVAELTGTYSHNDSTVRLESYDERGANLMLSWSLSAQWKFFIDGGWWRADYDTLGKWPSRRDDRFRAILGGTRGFSSWEIYVDTIYENIDSTWARQTYHSMVTQCGVRWYF